MALAGVGLDGMGALRRTHASRRGLTAELDRTRGRPRGLGAPPPRSRRRDLRRPARPGELVQVVFRPDGRARVSRARRRAAQRVRDLVRGRGRASLEDTVNPKLPPARSRWRRPSCACSTARRPRPSPSRTRPRPTSRRACAPHPRPAPAAAAAHPACCATALPVGARGRSTELGFLRDRDADARQVDARRVRATSWCRAGCSPARSTRCRSRRRS